MPDERFRNSDVKRVLVRLFLELHISEHPEFGGQARPSSNQRRDNTPYPRRYRSALTTAHEWPGVERSFELLPTGPDETDSRFCRSLKDSFLVKFFFISR